MAHNGKNSRNMICTLIQRHVGSVATVPPIGLIGQHAP